jgi:diguanylate cyclase (GGDEF)-like protein/PAS domain S-box-containing protein
MNHLLAELMRSHDLRSLAPILVEALLGAGAGMAVLLRPQTGWLTPKVLALLFGVVLTIVSWLTFVTALTYSYPQLSLSVPIRWVIPALTISLLGAGGAGAIQLLGRRSARNAMLAGSLLACGFSCMLFTGMAGVVKPFTLAYDLTAVLFIMVIGAALCGFAFWEGSNPARRNPWAIATGLVTLAIGVLTLGSLAAVLPFSAWMDAVSDPDDLASSPIAIIVAAEAVVVLVLSLSGSLIDNRVAARERLDTDRFRQLADSTLEGILIHRDGQILDGNVSLAALLGVELIDLRNSPLARFIRSDADTALWNSDQSNLPAQTEIIAANGSSLPVEILSRVISYGGRPAMVTSLRDVRERRASEERIHFLAHHDVLTELPNRVLLSESLNVALRAATRTLSSLAVLCLDLDGFKLVNDTLGHAAGDSLLRQVADRLRDGLRESDFVARIGGDEFVVLQTGGAQPEQAAALAQRIIECLAPSFSIDGHNVNVGTSIGIAFHPQDGETAMTLLKHADIALYRAKQNYRGGFQMFESGMDLAMRERRELEQDLRTGLQHNEFTLYFQPIFDRSLTLVAFEALVRWSRPHLGLVPPGQFIALAEQCGLIVPLGEWIMRTACTAAMSWHRRCRVAVNLSPAQFTRSDVQTMVAKILAETGLPPERLELEITEGVLIDNTDSAILALQALRNMGTRLVLDDFGTGYSSLSYLQRFPFDKLKVDRSFVQRLETDAGSRAIVKAIIAMSHSLNLEVTAEGVETLAQLQLLCAEGCHELQGFLLGHPMSQAEVDRFLHAHVEGKSTKVSLEVGPPAADGLVTLVYS